MLPAVSLVVTLSVAGSLLLSRGYVGSDGTPKITDFGLSIFSHPDVKLKSSAGSLSYLAPEIVRRASNKGTTLGI